MPRPSSDLDLLVRRPPLTRAVASLALVIVAMAVTSGCAGATSTTQPSTRPSSTVASVGVFDGTPAEYAALARACLRDKGFKTVTTPDDSTGFAIDSTGHSSKDVFAASQACDDQLGTPKMATLSDSELRARYDARVVQWNCLLAHKLVQGDPPTFDVFVDKYNRSGQQDLWEPTQTASTTDASGKLVGPSTVCPRSTF